MNPTEATKATTVRVGLFALFGLALIGVITVFVNDRPYWWRGCDPVFINVEDATGLKTKSPIRSLGLQIGYLHSVELTETRVKIGVCITAPVQILAETRAYIRGEGFLGDKFVELKPVKYLGDVEVGPRGQPVVPPTVPPAEVLPGAATSQSSRDHTQVREPSSAKSKRKAAAKRGANEPKPTVDPRRALEAMPVEIEKEVSPFETGGENGSAIHPLLRDVALTVASRILDAVSTPARAEDVANAQEIPVGKNNKDMDKILEQSGKLMEEMTELTKNLKEGLQPKELRETIQQLNKTLAAASKTLSPEGGLNATARRSLEKLEKAFEAMQMQMERINRGEGSVGRLLNDPVYADEMLKAMKGLNKLLGQAATIEIFLRLGAEQLPQYEGGRGFFQLSIYPNPTRYYLLGITIDPRGRRTVLNTTTTSGGTATTVNTEQTEEGGLLLTGMLGKIFWKRLDLAAGALHGDGAVSAGLHLGPTGYETMFTVKNDIYVRGQGIGVQNRLIGIVRPFAMNEHLGSVYLSGGLESLKKVGGKTNYSFGAGVTFSDNDIKLLFALR